MNKDKFKLSNRYFKSYNALLHIERKLKWADELEKFVLAASIEFAEQEVKDLRYILDENINKLFEVCKNLSISEIFIGDHELVTTAADYGGLPAVWQLTRILSGGRMFGCNVTFCIGPGNSYQKQTNDSNLFIPQRFLNKAWNVENRESIPSKKFKKFMVITGAKGWT